MSSVATRTLRRTRGGGSPRARKGTLAAASRETWASGRATAATGGMSRGAFIALMYAVLVVQLLLTLATMYAARRNDLQLGFGAAIGVFVAIVVLVLVLALVPMPRWLRLALFTVFSLAMGLFLHLVAKRVKDDALVLMCLAGTVATFVALSLLALGLAAAGFDLGWLGPYVLAISLAVVVASIALLVFKLTSKPEDAERLTALRKALLYLVLVAASVYIVFSTNLVLSGTYGGDYVDAALDLYLGFTDIFRAVLSLVGMEEA